MRKILLIALVCLLTACFFGCDGVDKTAHLGDPADTERPEREGAIMRYVSDTNSSLSVVIENNTESVWQSGNMRDYTLEAEKNGEWFEVEQKGEFANTMELMIFAPGDELSHTFDFSERYGTLAPGKYRVVKSWWANATETEDAAEFYLSCEFVVE